MSRISVFRQLINVAGKGDEINRKWICEVDVVKKKTNAYGQINFNSENWRKPAKVCLFF
jgi:hypothetical protein